MTFIGWIKNKFGRIITMIGAGFMSIEVFDIAPLKQPLADMLGEDEAKKIIGAIGFLCLVLSFIRHQAIANKVKALQANQATASVSPPTPPPTGQNA